MKQILDWLRGAILDKAFKVYDGTVAVDIHDVGELINEAEARAEVGYCEWTCLTRDTFVVEAHGKLEYRHTVRAWTFCPHCGKPRKIVGVETE